MHLIFVADLERKHDKVGELPYYWQHFQEKFDFTYPIPIPLLSNGD